jgi:hypothetical protein
VKLPEQSEEERMRDRERAECRECSARRHRIRSPEDWRIGLRGRPW